MSRPPRPELTISAVAAETGVSIANLRAWEQRHDFPRPTRSASGQRRYTHRDVELIRRVLEERAHGTSLEAAIARAQDRPQGEASIFAGLRRRRPELPVHVLSKRAMLAISQAIEDECCAHAERGTIVGAFQHERSYRRSEARWRELARTADQAVVFAEFASGPRRGSGPVELDLPPDAPLRREWAVVCHAPAAAACLAGFERPGGDHRFEAVWSVDPAIVHDAAAIAGELAVSLDERLQLELTPATVDLGAALRRATAVTNRVVAYLDR